MPHGSILLQDVVGPFKADMNAFVAEERTSRTLGPNGLLRAFKAASTHTSVRPTGPCRVPKQLLTTSPSPSTDSLPLRLREGVAAKELVISLH